MTRSTCSRCGDPIAQDALGWYHTRLPTKDGKPVLDAPPCAAAPGGKPRPGQGDLFEVTR